MRRFQSIAAALRALPAKDLILDGKAVVARGIRDFELLHADLVAGRKDRLLYAGKVRGGFTEADARDLRERLDQFIPKDSPLAEPVNKPKATCVEPVLEAEVACSTLTENSLLR
jgi:ATP-dependent DNA ligase